MIFLKQTPLFLLFFTLFIPAFGMEEASNWFKTNDGQVISLDKDTLNQSETLTWLISQGEKSSQKDPIPLDISSHSIHFINNTINALNSLPTAEEKAKNLVSLLADEETIAPNLIQEIKYLSVPFINTALTLVGYPDDEQGDNKQLMAQNNENIFDVQKTKKRKHDNNDSTDQIILVSAEGNPFILDNKLAKRMRVTRDLIQATEESEKETNNCIPTPFSEETLTLVKDYLRGLPDQEHYQQQEENTKKFLESLKLQEVFNLFSATDFFNCHQEAQIMLQTYATQKLIDLYKQEWFPVHTIEMNNTIEVILKEILQKSILASPITQIYEINFSSFFNKLGSTHSLIAVSDDFILKDESYEGVNIVSRLNLKTHEQIFFQQATSNGTCISSYKISPSKKILATVQKNSNHDITIILHNVNSGDVIFEAKIGNRYYGYPTLHFSANEESLFVLIGQQLTRINIKSGITESTIKLPCRREKILFSENNDAILCLGNKKDRHNVYFRHLHNKRGSHINFSEMINGKITADKTLKTAYYVQRLNETLKFFCIDLNSKQKTEIPYPSHEVIIPSAVAISQDGSIAAVIGKKTLDNSFFLYAIDIFDLTTQTHKRRILTTKKIKGFHEGFHECKQCYFEGNDILIIENREFEAGNAITKVNINTGEFCCVQVPNQFNVNNNQICSTSYDASTKKITAKFISFSLITQHLQDLSLQELVLLYSLVTGIGRPLSSEENNLYERLPEELKSLINIGL